MLACVCLNPSFDRTVSLRSFTAGDVNRVLSARQDVGGKGINVAITARRLGIASCVLGCAGKKTALTRFAASWTASRWRMFFLPVDGDVRTNMKIVPQDGTGVTELNEPGAPVNAANQRAFSDLLAEKDGCGAVCRPDGVAAAGMSAGVLPRLDALPAGAPVCAGCERRGADGRGWQRVRSLSSRTKVNCKPP